MTQTDANLGENEIKKKKKKKKRRKEKRLTPKENASVLPNFADWLTFVSRTSSGIFSFI